jgi:hypothetical protein
MQYHRLLQCMALQATTLASQFQVHGWLSMEAVSIMLYTERSTHVWCLLTLLLCDDNCWRSIHRWVPGAKIADSGSRGHLVNLKEDAVQSWGPKSSIRCSIATTSGPAVERLQVHRCIERRPRDRRMSRFLPLASEQEQIPGLAGERHLYELGIVVIYGFALHALEPSRNV